MAHVLVSLWLPAFEPLQPRKLLGFGGKWDHGPSACWPAASVPFMMAWLLATLLLPKRASLLWHHEQTLLHVSRSQLFFFDHFSRVTHVLLLFFFVQHTNLVGQLFPVRDYLVPIPRDLVHALPCIRRLFNDARDFACVALHRH